jgi:hypothetical protein
MPRLSRYFIKTGLIYLVGAFVLGLAVAARPALGLPAWLSAFSPVLAHLFVVGWITQLIVGVAYWMFPKMTKDNPRGDERFGWLIYVLLNAGLLLRLVFEPLLTVQPDAPFGFMLVVSGVCQLLAGWGVVIALWPRVKVK